MRRQRLSSLALVIATTKLARQPRTVAVLPSAAIAAIAADAAEAFGWHAVHVLAIDVLCFGYEGAAAVTAACVALLEAVELVFLGEDGHEAHGGGLSVCV